MPDSFQGSSLSVESTLSMPWAWSWSCFVGLSDSNRCHVLFKPRDGILVQPLNEDAASNYLTTHLATAIVELKQS